jgi:energy-coupling factor transport system ATP-binding protein
MLPVPSKLYKEISELANQSKTARQAPETEIPVTVREVKPWFETLAENRIDMNAVRLQETDINKTFSKEISARGLKNKENTLINMSSIYFRFDKNSEDVINNLSLRINRGEMLSIVGGNGAGKTTLLRLACGIIKPYSGEVKISDKSLKISYLPQNPQSMFAYDTVIDDLLSVEGEMKTGNRFLRSTGIADREAYDISNNLRNIINKLGIEDILEQHPYDLSVGELQRAALGMLLIKTPEVLLLDEPTKGIDKLAKSKTAELLRLLCDEGLAVVAVTHDIEFSAEYSNNCAMLFDGRILNIEPPEKFFSGNMCYTTVAHRIAGNIFTQTVTVEEVKNKWKEFAKEN